jgi:hypothetical protein
MSKKLDMDFALFANFFCDKKWRNVTLGLLWRKGAGWQNRGRKKELIRLKYHKYS